MSQEPDLVQIRTCQGWHLAQIYKSKLEAAEIPVLLKYEALGLVYGLTVDGLGEVRILVPKEYEEEATAMLEEIEEPLPEETEEPPPEEAQGAGVP
ncbi:MAG: DUF2007 domain-containing protein [Anaerolineae bacterium]